MSRLLFAVISVIILYGLGIVQAVESPDGFVVWSEGEGCDRQLMYQKLEKNKGPVEEKKIAVNKGVGADIMVVISFDGRWIAFARANSRFDYKYGACDYHKYDNFDIYIAPIDGVLPAIPKKVGHGYWPTWSDDSKGVTKTLYFTNFLDQTIQKTTMGPDGSFSPPVTHATCLKKMSGTNAHTQGSPNGKYIAYRPAGIKVQDIAANTDIPSAGGPGQHPCWGPRSQYLIWAKNRVCLVKEGLGRDLGRAGFGAYHYGISNDAEYEQGKLWAIGRMTGSGQNSGGVVEFKPIDISSNGWKSGSTGTKVTDKGTWCDIHVEIDPTSVGQNSKPGNGLAFKPFLSAGAHGLQLGIDAYGLEVYSAGLYNIQGRQKAFINIAGPSRNHIPLRGVADGMYVLKLSTARGGVQKATRIAR